MNTFTDILKLVNCHPVQVPLRYEGEPVPPEQATAIRVMEATHNRGVLLYKIGVRNSKLMPPGYLDANVDVRKVYEMELDARGASKIADVFQHSGVLAGPTVCVMGSMVADFSFRPVPVLRSVTPLLIPDRMHLEHVMDALCATNLPGDYIHEAVALVNEIRTQARFAA